jgi:hypothetical protein
MNQINQVSPIILIAGRALVALAREWKASSERRKESVEGSQGENE